MGRCLLYKENLVMISIVTGTLNRLDYLPQLIENTVGSNEKLELVLVDGGSIDGTIDYIKKLNNPRIRLVEVGERSYYWHYMNIGIENSSHEWVCQWNDDVIMETSWDNIFTEIENDNPYDFYIFSWKENSDYIIIENDKELVMNYGIYNKRIFREIGMYDSSYKYYFCDGDMSFRAKEFGFSFIKMYGIRCNSLTKSGQEKKAIMENYKEEIDNYYEKLEMYKRKEIANTTSKLN